MLAPGYRDDTGALSNKAGLATAKRLVLAGRPPNRCAPSSPWPPSAGCTHLDAEPTTWRPTSGPHSQPDSPPGCSRSAASGHIVAAKILGETRGVDRFPTAAAFAAHTGTAPLPASSGNTTRHRLNRGGNRQLNRALFTIAMVQARWHPDARAYLERKRAEGKTPAEARRCLKRHLAKVVYDAMRADAQDARTQSRRLT